MCSIALNNCSNAFSFSVFGVFTTFLFKVGSYSHSAFLHGIFSRFLYSHMPSLFWRFVEEQTIWLSQDYWSIFLGEARKPYVCDDLVVFKESVRTSREGLMLHHA